MNGAHDNILASGIGFNDADLAANREGRLSEKQAERLLKARRNTVQGMVGIMVLLTVILLPLAVLGQAQTGSAQVSIVIGLVWLGLMGLFLAIIRSGQAVQADAWRGQVEIVRGPVQCYTSSQGDSGTQYNLRVGDVTFHKVDRDAYIAFKHLDAYIIYYTPQSKQIVAAEPLAGA